MAYVPNSGSVVAFQSNPANLQASVTGTVTVRNGSSISGTVGASVIGTVPVTQVNNPWVITGSVQGSFAPSGNQSVSGTVNVGNFPATQAVTGSVAVLQGTNPFIITGSVQGSFTPSGNQSVSGTVQADVRSSVAVVIIGGSIAASFTPPANQSVSGTVTANQGTNPWIITGSVQASLSPAANQSISGTVGASLIGLSPVSVSNFPTSQNISGSVVAFQGTNPWIITGSVQASLSPAANQSVSGTVTVGSLIAMPGIVSTANSTTATLGIGAAFTGTSEEVKDFGSIVINVFADQASATDGLSIQQSSNGTNWDITDTYTISASTGKTVQVQPAARFFRIVYTNGGTGQGAFRLQTIYHPQMVKPTSQRAQDAYTNETDLEQQQAFGMVYNGSTWDRMRGTITAGVLVNPGASSVLVLQTGTVITSISGVVPISGSVAAFQAGTQITSIAGSVNIGTGGPVSVMGTMSVLGTVPVTQSGTWITSISGVAYAEDSAHADGNPGLFVLGVRNDTVSSFVSANTDYTPLAVDSAGRAIVKPFAAGEASVISHSSVISPGITTGSVLLAAAPGVGLKTYITDFNISNTGATTTLVTFADTDSSIVGRTIAPAGGGSNHHFGTPLTTWTTNKALTMQLSVGSSIVYATITGYKAP